MQREIEEIEVEVARPGDQVGSYTEELEL